MTWFVSKANTRQDANLNCSIFLSIKLKEKRISIGYANGMLQLIFFVFLLSRGARLVILLLYIVSLQVARCCAFANWSLWSWTPSTWVQSTTSYTVSTDQIRKIHFSADDKCIVPVNKINYCQFFRSMELFLRQTSKEQ
jgi:hypothetical protein